MWGTHASVSSPEGVARQASGDLSQGASVNARPTSLQRPYCEAEAILRRENGSIMLSDAVGLLLLVGSLWALAEVQRVTATAMIRIPAGPCLMDSDLGRLS
jgi:hypothetical protein